LVSQTGFPEDSGLTAVAADEVSGGRDPFGDFSSEGICGKFFDEMTRIAVH
jgi:hypothetical protein